MIHAPRKLGKRPARHGAIKFKLKDFINRKKLPKPPASFGHEKFIGAKDWMVLGNDNYGDCVLAGAAHETMLWCAMGGNGPARFTAKGVLSDYSAITGFDPKKPATDQGTDMEVAAGYRRKTGVVDAKGKRHKIAAYLGLDEGDPKDLAIAMYLFGAVGIGIEWPASAEDQFETGKPWSVVPGARVDPEGGHYVPCVAMRGGQIVTVTWGQLQRMTVGFYKRFNDETVAYVSEEALIGGKSPEGFDRQALLDALKALG